MVVSPLTARRYVDSDKTPAQIGEELGVDYLLYGSVHLMGKDKERRVLIAPEDTGSLVELAKLYRRRGVMARPSTS